MTARDSLGIATAAAAGIPLELLVATAAGASREGFRRFERTTLRPLARMIGREVERKLDTLRSAWTSQNWPLRMS